MKFLLIRMRVRVVIVNMSVGVSCGTSDPYVPGARLRVLDAQNVKMMSNICACVPQSPARPSVRLSSVHEYPDANA